jgi:hypothetical protein
MSVSDDRGAGPLASFPVSLALPAIPTIALTPWSKNRRSKSL